MSTTVYGEVPIVNSDASIHLLGADLLARVLEKLNGCDVAKAECACRGFHEAAGDQGLWLHLIRRDFEGMNCEMCRLMLQFDHVELKQPSEAEYDKWMHGCPCI